MPEVSKIVAALQQAMEGLRSAQGAAAEAAARADQVQSRAAQSGFRRVAEGVSQARDRLKRVQEMQAAVTSTLKGAADIVHQVNDDMSPGEVVSTLAPAAQQIGAGSASAMEILTEVDRIKTQIAGTLRGGQPAPLIAVADRIKQGLLRAVASLADAKRHTDEVIVEAQRTGNF